MLHSGRKIKIVGLLSIMMIGLFACQHDIFEGNGESGEEEMLKPCDPSMIHYMNDIQPILTSSCAIPGCHDALTPTAGVNLSDFDAVMSTKVRGELIVNPGNPGSSILHRSLRSLDIIVPMPPPFNYQITSSQKNLIRKWIEEGAQNLEPCLDISCDTNQFDWTATIRPIIRTYCNGCHFGDYALGDVELSFHLQVQELALNGDLYNSIIGGEGLRRMPLDVALPDCKITQIRKWIENGAPRD